jgi:tetratricopeptide (TPR) repeat protein
MTSMPIDANRVDPDEQNEEAYDELIVSIEASEGTLSLLIAACDDNRLRDEIIDRYEAELAPDIRNVRLPIQRGEPSLTQTIRTKVQEDEYLRNGERTVVTITGTEQLFFLKLGEDRSEQEIFFGYLQWTREALRDFHFPIVLWVTHQLLGQLARHAPDFWSWRKGVFRFTSRKSVAVRSSEIEAIRPVLDDLNLSADDDHLLPLEDLKALIAQTEVNQPKDPLLASLYSQMGQVYVGRLQRGGAIDYQKEMEAAISYFRKAEGLQAELGQETDLVNSLGWLGRLYADQGRYNEAEPLCIKALETGKRLLGEDHSSVADNLNNLASIYESQGRYSEAEPLYVQALDIVKRQLGIDHQATATNLNNLAGLYESQGRYSEAEPLYMQALDIAERQLGTDHPNVATNLNNLANLYRALERTSEAELMYVQALEMSKRLLGEDHPAVVTRLNNLASLYESQGRISEAEPMYVQALDIAKQQLGIDHPNTVLVRKNLEELRSKLTS